MYFETKTSQDIVVTFDYLDVREIPYGCPKVNQKYKMRVMEVSGDRPRILGQVQMDDTVDGETMYGMVMVKSNRNNYKFEIDVVNQSEEQKVSDFTI